MDWERSSPGCLSRSARADLRQSLIRAHDCLNRMHVPPSPGQRPGAINRRYAAPHAAGRQGPVCQIRVPGEQCPHRHTFAAGPVQKAPSRYTCKQTSASCRAPSHLGTRIKLRHLSQISTWNHHIQRPTASAPWFGTILALVSNHPRRIRLPPVSGAKKHGKRQEKACLGEEFPRILARCLSSAQCVGRLADVPFEHSALTPGTTRP